MNRFSTEDTPNGTPLASAQDASRKFNQPSSPLASEAEKTWRKHDDTDDVGVDGIEKESNVEELTPTRSRTRNSERPAISRQTTSASIAAAPFIGPFCSDAPSMAGKERKENQVRPRSSSRSSSASTLRE